MPPEGEVGVTARCGRGLPNRQTYLGPRDSRQRHRGDILGLVFCFVLTWGIVAELRAAAYRAIELAVLEERRRLARDLHDGVAQELAFIATQLEDLPQGLHPALVWVRSAADLAGPFTDHQCNTG